MRRTAFMRNLKTILEDLDVRYTMPIQPVLLPRSPAAPGSPRMQLPLESEISRRETLGNAGSFQESQYLRAPGRTFYPGVEEGG